MSDLIGIPEAAAISINDLLDTCVKVEPGQNVLLVAHIDGLSGGDNLVDQEAMSWIQTAIQLRGANTSMLWIDEKPKNNAWRLPPILKAAMKAANVTILNSFDITFEEIVELKQFVFHDKIRLIRNFASTAPLLCSSWAQTPNELVSAIRYQAALSIVEGSDFVITDPNGTHLEGKINPVFNPNHPWFTKYALSREDSGGYIPWPEWVVTPIRLANTSGLFVFDVMLSWWSRYIGISPYFNKPIRITVVDGKMTKIEGGEEAEALKIFLASKQKILGNAVYDFNCLHFGVHPQAIISPQECPNILYRRMIEHSHSSNLHAHIGAPAPTEAYPYWVHCTGDIRNCTFKVGGKLIHDKGHLAALDDPVVKAVEAKYPGRPGLGSEPRRF
jgi:hypothetical protein